MSLDVGAYPLWVQVGVGVAAGVSMLAFLLDELRQMGDIDSLIEEFAER